jgi:hypothetical protein
MEIVMVIINSMGWRESRTSIIMYYLECLTLAYGLSRTRFKLASHLAMSYKAFLVQHPTWGWSLSTSSNPRLDEAWRFLPGGHEIFGEYPEWPSLTRSTTSTYGSWLVFHIILVIRYYFLHDSDQERGANSIARMKVLTYRKCRGTAQVQDPPCSRISDNGA